jgi:hypothetical protein
LQQRPAVAVACRAQTGIQLFSDRRCYLEQRPTQSLALASPPSSAVDDCLRQLSVALRCDGENLMLGHVR